MAPGFVCQIRGVAVIVTLSPSESICRGVTLIFRPE